MAVLIKLVFSLILISSAAVYGGDIWNGVKNKAAEFINPEVQKANVFDSFKNKFGEIENVIKEVRENIDNPDFDKKAVLEKGLKIIEESKSGFEKIKDLKEGVKTFFSDSEKDGSQECKCSLENE